MSQSDPAVLTSKDFALIENLLLESNDVFSGLALAIRRKLLNARLVFPEDIKADVVTVDSRVRYRVNHGPAEERTLVTGLGDDNNTTTCVLGCPRGLALLGASAGQTVQAMGHDGVVETLQIEAVLSQPEAERLKTMAARVAPTPPSAGVSSLNAFRRRSVGSARPAPDDDDPGPRAA